MQLLTRVDSWLGCELLAADIPLVADSDPKVTEDAEALIGGALTFEVAATDRWSPEDNRDTHPLGDVGQRLHVTRYVVDGFGQRHPVSLGWFRILESPVEDGLVRVRAGELWTVPADYTPIAPIVPVSGSAWDALAEVLADTLPVPPALPAGVADVALGDGVAYDEGRLEAVQALLSVLGLSARVDPAGVIAVYPEPAAVPVLTFRDGVGGTVVSRVPTVGAPAPNAYVVRTVPEGDDPPIQAVAVIDAGPARWGGPSGWRVQTWESPLVTSYAECLATAERLLARAQARARAWKVTAAPDPRLQADDVIRIEWTDHAGASSPLLLRVTQVEHPLTPGLMTITGTEVT